ncbi:MAG: glycosyltransferase family 4 protein [Solirubrobacteraceae bacterium]
MPDTPIRLLRVIARLNIGGPAIQAISLTRLLQDRGYESTLVRGSEAPGEGSMDHLAAELGVRPVHVRSLRRDPGPQDLRALFALIAIIARERPRIVHTHAAKAGTLGRLAALLAPGRSSRVIVHTFHGHSLRGYFSARTQSVYLAIERVLAGRTDRLIAVSEEVRDDLVQLGVAPAERFEVIPLGFDLSPFTVGEQERSQRGRRLRAELGIPEQARLVTLIARLVAIKRVDRFLRIASLLADRPDVRFMIVGDGELREQLHASAPARALTDLITWTGFRRDMPDVCFASDVVVLTSENEGTPVSLIEAQAAGTPVISTNVGGVASAVRDGGVLVEADDERSFAEAIVRLLDDREMGRRMADAGGAHVRRAFAQQRLLDDLDGLYRRLLGAGPLCGDRPIAGHDGYQMW